MPVMIIICKNVSSEIVTLSEYSITLAPGQQIDLITELELHEIQKCETLFKYITESKVVINNGSQDLLITDAIKYLHGKRVLDEVDLTGKPVLHQTSRPINFVTCWMGRGDDLSNISSYFGNGEPCIINHRIGEQDSPIYIDYYSIHNSTFLHEGSISYSNCQFDRIKCQIVPQLVEYVSGSNTDYQTYNGIIIPSAGTGDVELDPAKIILPNGGLVAVQLNEHSERLSAGFWDADWNDELHQFENILPAPDGSGAYNFFYYEMIFATFVVDHLVGFGDKVYQSSDVDQFTHGLRIKIMTETCGLDWQYEGINDHEWQMTFNFVLHRARLS